MKKEEKLPIHHRIRHRIYKFHKIRKQKESDLPCWKHDWNQFNERNLGWLEHFVDRAIPWIVLLLFIIILGEFSYLFNFHDWAWLTSVSDFFQRHSLEFKIVDDIIVAFFVVDLYFNFFKKKTFWSFLKTSILDIIAIAPLGLIFRVSELGAEVGRAQSALHVASDIELGAIETIEGERATSRLLRAEQEAVKLAKLEHVTKLPRFIRLHRIAQFFGKNTHLSKKNKDKRKK